VSKLFLRHGEVKNSKDIFYGDLVGYELSKKGHEQALKASEYIYDNFNIKYNINTLAKFLKNKI